MPLQNYVSKELTHFVGRTLHDKDKQYALLTDILKSNWITHYPHLRGPSRAPLAIRLTSDSVSTMYQPSVVCFCDIPQDDLEMHMRKYSRFGLAFRKSFLVPKGANPVFYIAEDSKVEPKKHDKGLDKSKYNPKKWREFKEDGLVDPLDDKVTRSEYFGNRMSNYLELPQDILPRLGEMKSEAAQQLNSGDQERDRRALREFQRLEGLERRVNDLYTFLDHYVFSFTKFFDSKKSEEHEDNYYMEREWRLLGNVYFELSDVYRIILPESYAEAFRKDFPDYAGQITFSDAT